VKQKSKDRILDFFQHYSHEILSESCPLTSGNLRHWYTLPYVDEPEKDNEFSVYFSTRWMELLRITLHNFLTIVFATATPPKLLLLEKWFRTDKQLELRSQLKLLNDKMDLIINRFEKYEERLQNLRDVIRVLCSHIHNNLHMQQFSSAKVSSTINVANNSAAGQMNALFDNDKEDSISTNLVGSSKRYDQKQKEIEQSVLKISAECARKSAVLGNLSKDQRMKEILGEIYLLNPANAFVAGSHDINDFYHSSTGNFSTTQATGTGYVSSRNELEELENDLVVKIQEWIGSLKNDH
jgi:hypothetical protein